MRALVTGGSGFLGTAMQECVPHGLEAVFSGLTRGSDRLDVTDEAAVSAAVADVAPDVIVHLAAISRIDDVAGNSTAADDVNVLGSRNVARAAESAGCRLVALSSDVVFSGRNPPYSESSAPDPINDYGRSKHASERAIREAHADALIVRTSVLVGRDRADRFPFSSYILEAASAGRPVALFENERRNFFPVTMAARAVWESTASTVTGTVHVATRTSVSRFEFGVRLLEGSGLDPNLATAALGPPERPSDLTLDVSRAATFLPLPTMDEAISETLADLAVA